jgi:FkbM family methyltransferase
MGIKKIFVLRSYTSYFKRKYEGYIRNKTMNEFISGISDIKDKTKAIALWLSMESPFEKRNSYVIDFAKQNGSSVILFKHLYFEYKEVELDLFDNFQMAICYEFFIDNVYDLNLINFEPELIVDCGGYKGYFSILAYNKYNSAHTICIEALPRNFKDIVATAERNNLSKLKILNKAVSKSEQPIELYFEGSSASTENTFTGDLNKLSIETISLYELIKNHNNLLLKVDIEGSELDFFPEIISDLPVNCAVFLETHDGWNSLKTIRNRFEREGFSFQVLRERGQFIDSFAKRNT